MAGQTALGPGLGRPDRHRDRDSPVHTTEDAGLRVALSTQPCKPGLQARRGHRLSRFRCPPQGHTENGGEGQRAPAGMGRSGAQPGGGRRPAEGCVQAQGWRPADMGDEEEATQSLTQGPEPSLEDDIQVPGGPVRPTSVREGGSEWDSGHGSGPERTVREPTQVEGQGCEHGSSRQGTRSQHFRGKRRGPHTPREMETRLENPKDSGVTQQRAKGRTAAAGRLQARRRGPRGNKPLPGEALAQGPVWGSRVPWPPEGILHRGHRGLCLLLRGPGPILRPLWEAQL